MVNASVEHVTAVFREATAEQVLTGSDWYKEAHSVAEGLSERYGVTLEVAAGVIAALSPMQSWGANKNLAERFLAAGGLDSGYLSSGLAKARAILEGLDPEVAFGTPTSRKTRAFYHSIVTSGITDSVCIDRHAYDIATDTRNTDATRPSLAGKRYDEVARVYIHAARVLSAEFGEISPAQVQAVTWVAWRQKFWAVGAFDGK